MEMSLMETSPVEMSSLVSSNREKRRERKENCAAGITWVLMHPLTWPSHTALHVGFQPLCWCLGLGSRLAAYVHPGCPAGLCFDPSCK